MSRVPTADGANDHVIPMAGNRDDRPLAPDGALAHAREARCRAEVLRELAFEVRVEAMITRARARHVPLSPLVEAELLLRLGKEAPGIGAVPHAEPRASKPMPSIELDPRYCW